MVRIVPSLVTERIESVKAGIVGAGGFAISELAIIFTKATVIQAFVGQQAISTNFSLELLFQIFFGAVSGFLFGVTYRYVIRNDQNSHLNDGAVFAFGLIRGLALIENSLVWSEIISLMFLIVQSMVCFAIARYILDLAIARKLIKPFI